MEVAAWLFKAFHLAPETEEEARAKALREDAAARPDDGRVVVLIRYCNSCGFGDKALAAKEMLYEEHPSTEIDVRLSPDEGATGSFEITVDGELVHSKLKRQEGFLTTNARQQVIVLDAIAAAIEKRRRNAAT